MRKKIYIIDDVPDILEALSVILTDAGYEVTTAEQFEGVNQILDTKPDLILLDLLLIGTSGTSICENIKKTRAGKKIPILMISAHPQVGLANGSNGQLWSVWCSQLFGNNYI